MHIDRVKTAQLVLMRQNGCTYEYATNFDDCADKWRDTLVAAVCRRI